MSIELGERVNPIEQPKLPDEDFFRQADSPFGEVYAYVARRYWQDEAFVNPSDAFDRTDILDRETVEIIHRGFLGHTQNQAYRLVHETNEAIIIDFATYWTGTTRNQTPALHHVAPLFEGDNPIILSRWLAEDEETHDMLMVFIKDFDEHFSEVTSQAASLAAEAQGYPYPDEFSRQIKEWVQHERARRQELELDDEAFRQSMAPAIGEQLILNC